MPGAAFGRKFRRAVAFLGGLATPAVAQPTSHPDAQLEFRGEARDDDHTFRRSYGQMEFGANVLTLPDAEVCSNAASGCRKGDASLAVSGWPMYRATERFAIGAGLGMSLTTSSAPPPEDPPDIPRQYSRDYFTVEGALRFYPIVEQDFELWFGAVSGLVVVRDGFAVQFDGPENVYIGPESVTIASEGLTLSASLGGAFLITRSIGIGAQFRAGSWFLPDPPALSNLGDPASLSGSTALLDFGVMFTYRVPP